MLKVLLIGCCLSLFSCAQWDNAKPESENSLYLQLGGADGVEAIVDSFLFEVGGNSLVLPFFEKTNIDRFREKLIEQICQISDGPCVYSGDPMSQVHSHMQLDDRHFNAVVTDFVAAMDAENIPHPVQNRLLAKLASLYGVVMGDS